MPTQIQLEVIFAENGIATRARVLQGTDKQRVNKDETGKRNVSLLSKVLEQCHVYKFGIYRARERQRKREIRQ